MILIDKREKNSMVVAELIGRKQEMQMQQLAVADYIIGDIAIERKTISDFVSSMLSKRLHRQIEEMKQYPRQMLVIEGMDVHPLQEFGKINPNAVRGMLLSIMLDFRIPVVFTKDCAETAEFLVLLEKRQSRAPKEFSMMAKKRASNIYEQQQFILEAFPGIGPATAKALLKQFGSVKNVMNADEQELINAKLHKNKASAMKKIIEAKYLS
jgi:Fanconi anemia group M protein